MRLKSIILLAFLFTSIGPAFTQDYSVMTYNIRYDNPNDGDDRWDNRKAKLVDQIKEYNPDIMGIQEGLYSQLRYLNRKLKDYTYIGVGRDDGKKRGEFSALFYNKKKYKVITHSTKWLSETPNKISVGWDAALERICTFALFESKINGQKIWVFNTHFDHVGELARKKSARLIVELIQTENSENYPVVLMGDFNLKPDEEPIQYLQSQLNDSRLTADVIPEGPFGTFNGFDAMHPLDRRIDYIFTSKATIQVDKYVVIKNLIEGRYPSDHLPVYIDFRTIKE